MIDHYSLPWSRSDNAASFSLPRVWIYCSRGPNNPSIAEVRPSCIETTENALSEVLANAEIIVRAVNSHAALVEALEIAREGLDEDWCRYFSDRVTKIDAALKLAKGE